MLPNIGVIFLFSFLSLLAGCSSSVSTPSSSVDNSTIPSYGDALVTASIGDARTLIPILASDGSSAEVCNLIFNGLVKYNPSLELVGDLAEKWEVSEDYLTITFHLRRDVHWHDGFPFTARDVEFTYQQLVNPNVKTAYSGDFERIKSLSVIDDFTVEVIYKEPFVPGLASWEMGILPRHLLEREDLNATPFSRKPVGTGPYRFVRWKTAELIELSANPEYFEGKPYMSRYLYRIIPDQAEMFLELQSGGIDLMGLTPLQFHRQTETHFLKEQFQKFRYPSFGYTYLGFNLNDWKFQDPRVRRAITSAIDRQEIINGILLGLGSELTGPFPPESYAYNREVRPIPYDPILAKKWFAEAGWEDHNGDGWLDKNGAKFEFTILTNQGNDQRKMTAEIIQKRLAQIGISVKIRIIEWSSFVSEFIDKRRFETVLLGWGLSRDPDLYDIWHSSKTKEGEFNFLSYSSAEVDDLLIQGRRNFNQEERRRIYHRIHEIIAGDAPAVFLYVPDSLPIVHRRFHGIKVTPIGIGYNLIHWYVPQTEQRYTR